MADTMDSIDVDTDAPTSSEITLYDQQHFLTYARLLDAEASGADWRESVRAILYVDVGQYPEAARRCWDSHLVRAHWIATRGYELALFQAGLGDPD